MNQLEPNTDSLQTAKSSDQLAPVDSSPRPLGEAASDTDSAADRAAESPEPSGVQRQDAHREARRWWLKLVLQPLFLLACGALLLFGLGVAQRLGYLAAGGKGGGAAAKSGGRQRYICPMMCTLPQAEPGRCPVCAMELVEAADDAGEGPSNSLTIDPAARRVANIQTVAVEARPLTRTIRAIGELAYDEGSLKSISAYVDGRLDRLYADFTGVVVKKGDHLAWVYSPKLYSAQVEYLLAREAHQQGRSTTLARLGSSSGDLKESAAERLIELGMTKDQIRQLEQTGKANSRLHLCAPISGTVIEKLAVEGQYVKEGQPIYKLADLSTVWLMLKLFPEDAAAIRYGQKVEARVQSLPERVFTGRVAFVDPTVDRQTRTVNVRVVIPNDNGLLRVGDYAKATILVQLGQIAGGVETRYDAELAGKFISPRHPHIVRDAPGRCPVCGIELVPASRLGYSETPMQRTALVVPRDAVLMAGDHSVVYVEVEPGRFELRQVVLGPASGDRISIYKGVKSGERVATRGNFLIDSQMQLAGNPSLIDPTKAQPKATVELTPEMVAALKKLPPADRRLAEKQRICPVTRLALGSMGTPPKVDLDGRPVFICCQGCEGRLRKDPDKHLANLSAGGSGVTPASTVTKDPAAAAALAKLTPAERALAERQGICPVAEQPLGSMGKPIKVDLDGRPVFICCEGCRESLLADAEAHLAKLARRADGGSSPAVDGDSMEENLPPVANPMLDLPPVTPPRPSTDEAQSGLPPIAKPEPIMTVIPRPMDRGATDRRPATAMPLEVMR